MGLTLPASTLPERLSRRAALEGQAESSGRTFRRHPKRISLEKAFLKPALKLALKATGLYGRGLANAREIQVTERQLAFPDLPGEFDGFRILHLSDLHIDSVPGLVEVLAAAVSEVQADICVMTGDYRFQIEGSCQAALEGMRQVVMALPACPVLGTLGNHDPCEIAGELEKLGVHLLLNESINIWRGPVSLSFAGVDDSYDYRTDDLEAALACIPNGAFRILLAHTPDLFAEAAAARVRLYLCGHTHGGQVRVPLIGSIVQNSSAPRPYTQGAWRHERMHGYTSSGIGCSVLPVRFNCPPEVVVFELTRSTGQIQPVHSRPRLSAVPRGLPRRLPA